MTAYSRHDEVRRLSVVGHIFISYRSTDREFALHLAKKLIDAHISIWMDVLSIQAGDDWNRKLEEGINECDGMILILSPGYVASEYCKREYIRAQSLQRLLFPVLLESLTEIEYPLALQELQFVDFRHWQDPTRFDTNFKSLAATIKEKKRITETRIALAQLFPSQQQAQQQAPMPTRPIKKIWISTPSDTLAYREVVRKEIERFNELSRELTLVAESYPDIEPDAQTGNEPAFFESQYYTRPYECDAIIAILAETIGTPTAHVINPKTSQPYQGRTEFELLNAHAQGDQQNFMIFRKNTQAEVPTIDNLLKQLDQPVITFIHEQDLQQQIRHSLDSFLLGEQQTSADENQQLLFDPSFYMNTFMRQYADVATVVKNDDVPIVEPIVRADLMTTYVPLAATDEQLNPIVLDDHIEEWLHASSQKTVVILGEYGFGKTSYCLSLTYELLNNYQQNPATGLFPIYLPFRDFIADSEKDFNPIDKIRKILCDKYRLISDNFPFPSKMQDHRIVLILDGLDEIEQSLDHDWAGRRFKQLHDLVKHCQKVIITCRTSYMSSEQSMRYVFPMSDNQHQLIEESVKDQDLEILTLTGFDESRKQLYLSKVVQDPHQREVLEDAITRIRDLPDLTKRPVLLWMLVDVFLKRKLDLRNLENISTTQLYQHFTDSWLSTEFNDTYRYEISPQQSRALFENLALKIANTTLEQIHHNDLQQAVREHFPGIGGQALERRMYELKVCSFFRPAQDNHFSFVHRSFMEFFVARALYQQIAENRSKAFGREKLKLGLTPQFVAEIIKEENYQKNAEKRLQDWLLLGRDDPQKDHLYLSSNAATILCRMGARFRGLNLLKVNLKDSNLIGGDLRGVILREANLDNALLGDADFSGADLRGAQLNNVYIHHGVFRRADLRGAEISNPRIVNGPNTLWIALYDPSQEYIVLGTDQGTLIIIHRAHPQQPLHEIKLNNSCVLNCVFSPDGKTLAVADRDNNIFLYDWELLLQGKTGDPLVFADNEHYIRWLEFSIDGRTLASGGRDTMVKLWKLGDNPRVVSLRYHVRPVMSVQWSSNGQFLVSGGYDASICLWNLQNEDDITHTIMFDPDLEPDPEVVGADSQPLLRSHDGYIRCLAFSDNNQLLASGGEDGKVRLWDISDPNFPSLLGAVACDEWVFCVMFAQEDQTVIGGGSEGGLFRIDVQSLRVTQKVKAHHNIMRSFDLDPKQNLLLTSSWDRTVKEWQIDDFALFREVYEVIEGELLYTPPDAFAGANITGLKKVTDLYRDFYLRLGAIDHTAAPLITKPDTDQEPIFGVFNQASDPAILRATLHEIRHKDWYETVFLGLAPGTVPIDEPAVSLLQQSHLISSDRVALYRINFINELPFITDGAWHTDPVYIYTDEAEAILDYIANGNLAAGVDAIVDPACGCGHTPIGFAGSLIRYGFDFNPRAIAFTKINAWLNGLAVTTHIQDIDRGLPANFPQPNAIRALFTINMPFAISPQAGALPIVRDGGDEGLRWTRSALQAIQAHIQAGSKAVVLTYSLGYREDDRWQALEYARSLYANVPIKWTLIPGEIWRVGMYKQEPNPMSLVESLHKKADDEQIPAEKREQLRDAYQKLAQELVANGWDSLGAGILEIN